MASNDAKSYIATVLARADGATPGFGADHDYWAYRSNNGTIQAGDGDIIAFVTRFKDGVFIKCARQDIPTLGKIALRAIDVLKFITEESDCDREADDRVKDACWAALADINALAAKGSQ